MRHCYGAKALSVDSDCTTCGPMFIIHAWGRNSLDIGMDKSEAGCVWIHEKSL